MKFGESDFDVSYDLIFMVFFQNLSTNLTLMFIIYIYIYIPVKKNVHSLQNDLQLEKDNSNEAPAEPPREMRIHMDKIARVVARKGLRIERKIMNVS